MLEFVLDYFILVFLCKPSWVRMTGVRLVRQIFYVFATLSEFIKVIINGAEWSLCSLADLIRGFFTFQDRADHFVPLSYIHSITSRNLDIYASDIDIALFLGGGNYIRKFDKLKYSFSNIGIHKTVQYVNG